MPRYAFAAISSSGLGRDPADFAASSIAHTPSTSGFDLRGNVLHAPPPEPTTSPGAGTPSQTGQSPTFTVLPGGGANLPESVNVIQYTGASSNRVDIVFLGDGYTLPELATVYLAHVMGLLNYMFANIPLTDPFSLYRNFFNIYAIDVVSNQSGADDPTAGVFVDTALDASYLWDGTTQRLLYINQVDAINILSAALAGSDIGQVEMLFVTVNAAQYGGGGGYFGVFAGGNSSAYEVALHEIGHSFAGLGDEYWIDGTTYTGVPNPAVNLTTNPTGAAWSEWIGYEDPILGVVGAYEGGSYREFGIYRPTFNSRMRSLNQPFDAIAREAFILQFYSFVDPLDAWANNVGTQTNLLSLNVDTLDPMLIHVDWTVNGVLYADIGEVLDLSSNFGWGTFTIVARAYDPTPWVRGDRSSLEQSITWTATNDYRLVGTGGSETLTGNANAQTIVGLGGNDVLGGLGANDTLEGGAGIDTSVYSIASTSATWTRSPNGSWTVSAGADGTDTVTGVEFLDFTDRDVFLDGAANTFFGDGTSDILLRRTDGVTAIWNMGANAAVLSSAPTQWQAGAEWSIQGLGDFNSDGRDDFLLRRTDGVTAIWSMNGTSVIAADVTLWQAGNEWRIQNAGDFNGDGHDDILWRRSSDGVTAIWNMNGTNVVAADVTLWQAGNEWQIQSVGDFDGDGRDDFLWRRTTDGVTAIWQMNGTNVVSADVTSQQAGAEWSFVGVGDFDGDGRDDLLLRRNDGATAIWTMNGTGVTSANLTSQQAGTEWSVAAIGDYNGDGRDDILLRQDSGLMAVWTVNGFTITSANLTSQTAGPEWGVI